MGKIWGVFCVFKFLVYLSASVTAAMYAVSCYIGSCYNGARQYIGAEFCSCACGENQRGYIKSVVITIWLYSCLKWDINLVVIFLIIPPASTKLIGGYTGITLSVCPSVDRIVSALYLQQYSSDLFHICTSYQATSEGVSRVMPVSKFKNLKFWQIF